MTSKVIYKSTREFETFRISAKDTNRMALIFDPYSERTDFVARVEIFDEGGATPPNTHQGADEFFFVLKGQGIARCDGQSQLIDTGSALLVKAGGEHVIENTGEGRLYLLTVMVPDEEFAALIRKGVPAELDEADRAVLERI